MAEAEIRDKVIATLKTTPYASSSLTKLSGGNANFLYRATLNEPLQDGTQQVVVKQGESYVATNPGFALATSRCAVEYESLIHLGRLPPSTSPACVVDTPKAYYFDTKTHTQVQEYLLNAVSLKNYALEHYQPKDQQLSEPIRLQCLQIGHSLGGWLRSLHSWGQQPEQKGFREVCKGNKEMKALKTMMNYQQLVQMVDKHQHVLGDVKDVFQEIAAMASRELEDDATLQVIHGDFWTGNVLLPDQPIQEGSQTPIKIVDWELVHLGTRPLDLGQMIAELWQLKIFKDLDAGVWLIQGFVDSYGGMDADMAFRTIIHVGAHLICFGSQTPGWGTPEQYEDVVRIGKDVIVKAWNKDRDGFKGHALQCLFEGKVRV